MCELNLQIRKELESLAEPDYQKFAAALIPGIDNLIGVRVPMLRKLAKVLVKKDANQYLSEADAIYFEEVMLEGLVICELNDEIEVVLKYVEAFVPKIDNWSLCDSFCTHLKITRKHQGRMWEFITPYAKSNQTYEIRFAVVMMLFYYVEADYLNQLFKYFNTIKHDDYYVKMAIAWAISICFIKYPNETLNYLNQNDLDDFTFNKSLQKIRESTRVDAETKARIKQMKR